MMYSLDLNGFICKGNEGLIVANRPHAVFRFVHDFYILF